MKTKLVLLVSLLFSANSFAGDGLFSKVDLNLPNAKTLKKLSHEQLELYILGLREAAKDLEAIHAKEGVKFADANSFWKNFDFSVEAFAATAAPVMKCMYGGWPRPKNSAGKCTRPNQGKCDGQNFECPIIYGNVCVGYGNSARASCAASSPSADVIATNLNADVDGSLGRQWNSYTQELQSYCDTGAFRAHCQTLQGRVTEIYSVANVSSFVSPPNPERYPFGEGRDPVAAARPPNPTAATGATTTTANTSVNGEQDSCYSEILVQSTKCGPRGVNRRLMPPGVAMKAFCNEDKEYLETQIGSIRTRANTQMQCLAAEAKKGGDKYARYNAQEQVKIMRGMLTQLERCYKYVKGGGKISSAQLGTLTFENETNEQDSKYGMVMLSSTTADGRINTIPLQAGYTALSIVLQPKRGRFCDYNLVERDSSATSSGAAGVITPPAGAR